MRSVTNLLDRYDELLATSVTNTPRLRNVVARQGRAILALDGMQPDVGHEVLWVVRESAWCMDRRLSSGQLFNNLNHLALPSGERR